MQRGKRRTQQKRERLQSRQEKKNATGHFQ